jgi:cell division protease FtsH
VVDREVRALIEQAHTEAWTVLNSNRDLLDRLAGELLEKETLDHLRLAELFAQVEKLPERPQWLSNPERPVSDVPPIELPVSQHVDEVVEPDTEAVAEV